MQVPIPVEFKCGMFFLLQNNDFQLPPNQLNKLFQLMISILAHPCQVSVYQDVALAVIIRSCDIYVPHHSGSL